MPKVAINSNYGIFRLSDAARHAIEALDCPHEFKDHASHEDRTCPFLIAIVESMGNLASYRSDRNDIIVVNVPDDVRWHIHEYDGLEYVAEDHRFWCGSPNDGMYIMSERENIRQ